MQPHTELAAINIAQERWQERWRLHYRPDVVAIHSGHGHVLVEAKGLPVINISAVALRRRKASDHAVRTKECEAVLTYLIERGIIREDSPSIQRIKEGAHRD